MKILLSAIAICGLFAPAAYADVQDRVIAADVPPEVLYQEIVTTAKSMCREAADNGEVFNINRCTEIVVAKTIAEINRPNLTRYARTTTTAESLRKPA